MNIIKNSLFSLFLSLTSYYGFGQDSSAFETVYSDQMPDLPRTITTRREYTADSSILLLVNERKFKGQDWQTCFEFAYFRKSKSLINGGLICGFWSQGIDFKYFWVDQNNIKILIPKGVKFFKKNSAIELGKYLNGKVMEGETSRTIRITYVEK